MEKISVRPGRNRSSIFSCTALNPIRLPIFLLVVISAVLVLMVSTVSAEIRLSLSEAISSAEEHSFSIKSARHDSAASAFDYAGAKSERFPVLSLEARSHFLDELQSIETPLFEKEIGSKENYQADIMISLPLYTGGRISNYIGAARENNRAATRALESEIMASAYNCRKAYLNVLAAAAVMDAASSSLERLEIILKDVQNLYDGGMADSIDLLEAELAFRMGQQQLDLQKTNRANAMSVLARLIGTDENIILTEKIDTPSQPGLPIQSSSAEIDRPELRRYDHMIAAADKASAIENAGILPSLSSFAGYSYGKPNKDMFNNSWNDNFIVGVALNWQLNLGMQTSRNVKAARSRAASARMARKNMHDALITRRDLAANNLDHAFLNYQISGKEFDIAERRFRLARLRQEAGQISINRLLEMEADLTSTQQQYQAAIVRFYLSENDYLYAVGSDKIFGGLR